jgi:hypothetical protein
MAKKKPAAARKPGATASKGRTYKAVGVSGRAPRVGIARPGRSAHITEAIYGAAGVIGFVRDAPAARKRVRKNMDMDQDKLDIAKRVLGARTETDAVDAALDLVAFQGEVFAGVDRAVAAGGFANVFDD